jgi:hypothetical protein
LPRVFGVYLIAPVRFEEPYGSVCISVISRRHLPLVRAGSGRLGSWMDIVHNHRSIFRGFGGHPSIDNLGVVITLLPGTLAAIEHCPSRYRLQVWPLGYRGKRPELSARL